MTKTKKRNVAMVILLAMLIAVVVLGGCGNSSINEGIIVGIDGGEFVARFYSFPLFGEEINADLVSSEQELTELKAEKLRAFEKSFFPTASLEMIEEFSFILYNITQHFDKNFFENNQLIFINGLFLRPVEKFEVRRVGYQNSKLNIYIRQIGRNRTGVDLAVSQLGILEITRISQELKIEVSIVR